MKTIRTLLKKRLWIIGTSIYVRFDPNSGHHYKPGKDHYFFGTKEEMISHLCCYPNSEAWNAYSCYSDRIGGIYKNVLSLIHHVYYVFHFVVYHLLVESCSYIYRRL